MTSRSVYLKQLVYSDLMGLGTAACLSLVVGLGFNAFVSRHPVSLIYQRPYDRVLSAPDTLSASGEPGAVSIVTLQDVQTRLDRSDTLILDAQGRAFFDLGHLPGAISLSRDTFAQDFRTHEKALREPGVTLLVYCSDADCENGALVAQKLMERGFKRILLYPGGFQEWQDAGLPTEASE